MAPPQGTGPEGLNTALKRFPKGIPGWRGIFFGVVLTVLVTVTYMPSLKSWFDPQDFVSFLNPLRSDTPTMEYFNRAWSWKDPGLLDGTPPDSGVYRIGFYRPLTSAVFMMEFPLFGIDPLGYRITNLLMHLLCVAAVMWLVVSLGSKGIPVMAAGLLIAVHPGMSWAVDWITARNDVLAALFSLLAVGSVIVLRSGRKKSPPAWLPAVFALLAVAAKELGMVCFVAIPMLYFLWPGKKRTIRTSWIVCITITGVAALYLGARFLVFRGMGGYPEYSNLLGIPTSFLVLIGHVTGATFTGSTFLKAFLHGLPIAIVLLYAGIDRRRWTKVVLFVLLLGMFGSQSLLGEPCMHYIYVPTVFYVTFMVAFASRIGIRPRRWMKPAAGIAVLALVAMGAFRTHAELSSEYRRSIDRLQVFLTAELMQDEFPDGRSFVILLSDEGPTPYLDEIMHLGIYLSYFRPDHGCTFSVRKDPGRNLGPRVLVWDGTTLTPMSGSDTTIET